jgi:valine dehydrogenase (NAD+)
MTSTFAADVYDRFGVFERDDELDTAHHEAVIFFRDESTGLRAIVGVHDTTLGPALGGTRFFPYLSESAALTDVLRLSQGMTFKAAAAGMPLGGGKAVIIGDPTKAKTPGLLRAYGQFLNRLAGTYITAADVGTTSEDLDVVGETTRHVVGRGREAGGSGDSGFATAYGVHCAMTSAAALLWGPEGLKGRTVGVEGVGKVGFHLVGLLLDDGARVVVSDPSGPALSRIASTYAGVTVAESVINRDLDVYAPCALGATLTPASVARLQAGLVCGAANNQLLTTGVDSMLSDRQIVWVPDYVANAGGLIQVGSELVDASEEAVLEKVRGIGDTVTQILTTSRRELVTTGEAARRLVEERLGARRNARSG